VAADVGAPPGDHSTDSAAPPSNHEATSKKTKVRRRNLELLQREAEVERAALEAEAARQAEATAAVAAVAEGGGTNAAYAPTEAITKRPALYKPQIAEDEWQKEVDAASLAREARSRLANRELKEDIEVRLRRRRAALRKEELGRLQKEARRKKQQTERGTARQHPRAAHSAPGMPGILSPAGSGMLSPTRSSLMKGVPELIPEDEEFEDEEDEEDNEMNLHKHADTVFNKMYCHRKEQGPSTVRYMQP